MGCGSRTTLDEHWEPELTVAEGGKSISDYTAPGGSPAMGGMATFGGRMGAGGSSAFGASSALGGRLGAGGSAATRGGSSSGGRAANGGSNALGGRNATGGAAPFGGTVSRGGSANAGGSSAAGASTVAGNTGLDCNGLERILLLTRTYELQEFFSTTTPLRTIGRLKCDELQSMAVSLNGDAYVTTNAGQLLQIDWATLGCVATPFVLPVGSNAALRIGFGVSDDGRGESLRMVLDSGVNGTEIGVVDLKDYGLYDVVKLPVPLPNTEILGGPDGGIYLFGGEDGSPMLYRIDSAIGDWSEVAPLPRGVGLGSWDFTVFRGDFYLFAGTSIVTYRLGNPEMNLSGTIPTGAIGAGTTRCMVPEVR